MTLRIGHLDCDTRQSLDGEVRILQERSLARLWLWEGRGDVGSDSPNQGALAHPPALGA